MHKQHPQTAYRKYAVSLHDPSREKVNRENPQIFPIYKLQIIFPLNMRRTTRRAFKSSYIAPKIVALYGARGALPVKMRL